MGLVGMVALLRVGRDGGGGSFCKRGFTEGKNLYHRGRRGSKGRADLGIKEC